MTAELEPAEDRPKAREAETDEGIPLSGEENSLLERWEQAETDEEQLAIEALLEEEDTDAGAHGDEEEAAQEREVPDGNR